MGNLRRNRAAAVGHRSLRRDGLSLSEQTQEIAYGWHWARRAECPANDFRRGLTTIGAGLIIGLPLAYASRVLCRRLIFRRDPTDATTFVGIPVALMRLRAGHLSSGAKGHEDRSDRGFAVRVNRIVVGFRFAALFAIGLGAPSWAASPWKLTRNEHFYSIRGSDAGARSALLWFEQFARISSCNKPD